MNINEIKGNKPQDNYKPEPRVTISPLSEQAKASMDGSRTTDCDGAVVIACFDGRMEISRVGKMAIGQVVRAFLKADPDHKKLAEMLLAIPEELWDLL